MKVVVVIAGLLLLMCQPAVGQAGGDSRLAVTGTVVSVSAGFAPPKDKNGYSEKKLYTVNLLLQFRNQTDEPIVILRPDRFLGHKTIAFLRDVSSAEEVEGSQVEQRFDAPAAVKYNRISSFVNYLSGPAPPSAAYFAIIDVGGYYEFGEVFYLATGYKVKEKPGERLPLSKQPIISEYQALKVAYRLSLSDRKEGSDLLATAGQRWRKEYGDLILDSKGDYDVTSKIIMNKLSDPSD